MIVKLHFFTFRRIEFLLESCYTSLQKIEKNEKNESMVSSEMLYGTAVTDDSGEKLSTSPLLSLMPTRITSENIDFSIPDYPRLAIDNKLWYKKR